MLWFGVGCALVAVALSLWIVGRPWVLVQGSTKGAPADPDPLWWPWVRALEPWCAPWVTWGMRRQFDVWCPRAGLSDRWLVERWLAARCLLALASALAAAVFGLMTGGGVVWIVVAAGTGGLSGFSWPSLWLRRHAARRRLAMVRELPFMLDLLTLSVEAGLSLPSALLQVGHHAPDGPLCRSLKDAAALERTGMTRSRWLEHWAETTDVPGVRSLVLALAQADRLGMSLGPLLRAQAVQQRSERFLRAEKLALEAPVRMLFPMVLCIFPCTFLVIGFPVVVKFLESGL